MLMTCCALEIHMWMLTADCTPSSDKDKTEQPGELRTQHVRQTGDQLSRDRKLGRDNDHVWGDQRRRRPRDDPRCCQVVLGRCLAQRTGDIVVNRSLPLDATSHAVQGIHPTGPCRDDNRSFIDKWAAETAPSKDASQATDRLLRPV